MARRSANSLLNSLKGKIWLATSALAALTVISGLFSYFIVVLFSSNVFVAIFVPFLLLAFGLMVFGWWLSNEVVSPIEKVSLLAKSLERSPMASLPKTLGASEIDEVLASLHRNSQIMQNLVSLMDRVANGHFDVALTPLQNSDRLSSSFQKLLVRVSDSINAKQDLRALETSLERINATIENVRNGNLDARIPLDQTQTREIADTLNFLIENLNFVVANVRVNSRVVLDSSVDIKRSLTTSIKSGEEKAIDFQGAVQSLRYAPTNVSKIAQELTESITTAHQSIERVRRGAAVAEQNVAAVSGLRKHVQDAIKLVQRLNERSQEISKVAKTVEDLAHRTNLIALNASIQAAEGTEPGFAILAEEVERLASRAQGTNRDISTLNKSIAAELGEIENSMQSMIGEISNASKFAMESGNSLSELERYVSGFVNLQTKLANYSNEQALETEKALGAVANMIENSDIQIRTLRRLEENVNEVSTGVETLNSSVAHFRVHTPQPVAEEPANHFRAEESNGYIFADAGDDVPSLEI